MSTTGASWCELVERSTRAVAGLLPHRGVTATELSHQLGLDHVLFEAELDLAGAVDELTAGTVLRVTASREGDGFTLGVRYRTAALDAAAAARIAGYHR
ncbi:non-ribosomal peptide synthetase, partial [Streptomyces albulus]|nr:non-ribosomal peptide synthetase [Streptomyces noursei]